MQRISSTDANKFVSNLKIKSKISTKSYIIAVKLVTSYFKSMLFDKAINDEYLFYRLFNFSNYSIEFIVDLSSAYSSSISLKI